MQNSKPLNRPFRDHARSSLAVNGLLLLLWLTGCGGSSSSSTATTPATPQAGPQTYFAAGVAGGVGISTFSFDDKATTFSETIYDPQTQPGPQILNAGAFTVAQRGLRSLAISTTYVFNNSTPGAYIPTNFTTPEPGFAVELAGQAGGLAQLLGQPVAPLVAANACPNFTSAQTYQFVTIPGALLPAGTAPTRNAWDAMTETAYGSVDISSTGSTVNFKNIQQFTLPSAGGGTPVQPPKSSLTGTCGQTYYGYTIAVPGQAVITNPGTTGYAVPPQAIIGIGSSGLLVEDNGSSSVSGTLTGSPAPLPYENVMGAGTGAVGLPKPSAALDTGAVVGAQYLGFIYAAGIYTPGATVPGWSSHLASFGFSTVPPGCASVAASTGTLIYGGDFSSDNPSASSGNCDFAIDLGTQDSANNGRYPNATVWVGAGYAANSTGASYSFPAVAIAAQLNGKYAIFLIGEDSSQPWAIYLLQSN